jgi:hypothetical protein
MALEDGEEGGGNGRQGKEIRDLRLGEEEGGIAD